MAGQDLNIRLTGGGPWGFRLKGGKDFGQSLTVSQVTPGGKALSYGLNVGDVLISINGANCDDLTHLEAQDCIKRTGEELRMHVHRPNQSPSMGRAPLPITTTTHSANVDYKYNAIPKPFGAPSYQPQVRQAPVAQSAPMVRSGPPPTAAKPSYHPPPAAPPPPQQAYSSSYSSGQYGNHQLEDDAALRAKKKEIEDEMLAQRFKLNISDDGEVNYEGDEGPSWGHPPNPNVQSKSFKRLQKHLQQVDPEDDLPPPPPEAYADEDDSGHVQSKSFQMLSRAVDAGETPPSVFSRTETDRSKPSTTPLPMARPSAPVIRSARDPPQAPPAPFNARPGQAPPVALPGMVKMEPSRPPQAQPPRGPPQQRQPGYQAGPPSAPSYPGGGPQEIKRQPAKPPQAHDGPRTPYCDACGEEIHGPFVSAIGKSWHPDHFTCAGCGDSLQNQGFIEEGGKLYCEKDYNKFFAPHCDSCKQPIVGPKSLHACPPSTPKPSSAMLKAIREGGTTAANTPAPREPKINPSLALYKNGTDGSPQQRVHYPVHGIDYMRPAPYRRDSNSSSLSSNSRGSLGGSRGNSRSGSVSEGNEVVVSPKVVRTFERIHYEMTSAEAGGGSMRDKVVQMKEELRKAVEQEKEFKEDKEDANRRYQRAKQQSANLHRKILVKEDVLQRLEDKMSDTTVRLYDRRRAAEESLVNKERAETQSVEGWRQKENILYELSELGAARESALTRLKAASRKQVAKQAAIQTYRDHTDAMEARAKVLEDMIAMYKLRIENLETRSAKKESKNEDNLHRIHLLQDSIEDYNERYRRAEKMILPLKIHVNSLQDAVDVEKNNTRQLRYQLASYEQRVRRESGQSAGTSSPRRRSSERGVTTPTRRRSSGGSATQIVRPAVARSHQQLL